MAIKKSSVIPSQAKAFASLMNYDYPTLSNHFPHCFKTIQAEIIKSNDSAQSKITQIIHGFNDRLGISNDDIEIHNLQKGKEELRQMLKATVQTDIDNYLTV